MAQLLIEQTGDVLLLTFNQPEKMNALSDDIVERLKEVLQDQQRSPTARVIVLTGAGRGFSAGADLENLLTRRDRIGPEVAEGVNGLIRLMRVLPIPIVAAMNGAAAGAGASLALASDFIVASEVAKIHLAFSRIGAVMDSGASYFLTRALGSYRVRKLAMLGGTISAQEGLDWGLFHSVSKPETLMEDAMTLAERLASGPRTAISLIKAQIEYAEIEALNRVLDFEALTQAQAFAQEDIVTGVQAFLEGKKAIFA